MTEELTAVQAGIKLPDDLLVILPTRNVVLFPGVIAPITLGRETTINAVQEAMRTNRRVGLMLQRNPNDDEPDAEDLYEVGTLVNVLRYVTTQEGTHHLVVQGEERFKVQHYLHDAPYLAAKVSLMPDPKSDDLELEARRRYLQGLAIEVAKLLPQLPNDVIQTLQNISDAGALADLIANFMDMTPAEKQQLLEVTDLNERLERVSELLRKQHEVLKITREIDSKAKASMDERQREYMLREQMKAIRKQLGEDDNNSAELEELRSALEETKLPKEVDEHAKKELRRLEQMQDSSGEYSMVRTYLDWLANLPWSKVDEENIDIAKARQILDDEHFGLEKVKQRILEYLAVRKLNPQGRSPILCFVGPPGVGKTSMGQSIAHAMGLKFVRGSLGGVHDEAEIRGHRRTYLGALPGNIIQGLRKAGTRNPVFMLDEIDKLGGGGYHGDPSAALLEVLDPEQNSTFRDNYLAQPFDLSQVVFIATANVLDSIPGPLRDRMEIIELPGYTEEEKVQIAKRYLVKRQLETNGLKPEQVTITESALRSVIGDYTREAGVRNLDRKIGALLRRVAMQIAEGASSPIQIGESEVLDILGAKRFESEVAMRTSIPGVATGLAWTPVGGDILFIETTKMPGHGKLIITGQLGDVMKESAQAALSLVKSRAQSLGIDPKLFDEHDIHLHVPAGAIPKDGPSAGVAMFTSLVSLLTGRCVRSDVAMTGEISLRGLVLPIGGVKEKCLAALRAGIHTVLLPARNRKDLEEVPENARKQLQFIFMEKVEDAMAAALDCAANERSIAA
ncbi:endopeptidase La [uncultured Thiothrix sp.]|uniref:endopeptidase La n=1 Tax=uncultured Thiothrix sp. TaxID=223185 RepID=UPI00260F2A3E|nr:endopeptidase La [uncultured Thiothrix sp.]HMT93859.1 endopeptidase La [Thiolinea sp.]